MLPAKLLSRFPTHSFIPSYEVDFRAFGTLERAPTMTPVAAKILKTFDPKTFLSTIDGGRKIVAFSKKQAVFVQGDSSDAVFYLQTGRVKLTVVSKTGQSAF